jgi:mycofactocin precursor
MDDTTFPTNEAVISEEISTVDENDAEDAQEEWDEELEEELIIEDFTIDGICGVY